MSIKPVTFNADGSILVLHDDADGGPHGGIATPVFGSDHRIVVLDCPFPGCGSTSFHPIGGGAAPREVQEMFVRLVRRLGCPCGQVTPGRPFFIIQGHIKLNAERMDGIGRWQIQGTLT